MIVSLILAAGESIRMGTPKALLHINKKTFIRHIIDVYHRTSVEKIIVVLGAHAHEIEVELNGLDVTVVHNNGYRAGQLSSIIAGIAVAESFHAVGALLHPVDHPLISPTIITTLIQQFTINTTSIVLPVFHGTRGHPVVFPSSLFEDLRNASPEIGARSVVRLNQDNIVEVATDEEGVVFDIDTPEDYNHL